MIYSNGRHTKLVPNTLIEDTPYVRIHVFTLYTYIYTLVSIIKCITIIEFTSQQHVSA